MEKITSIRKGRIWVNVYKNQDGDMAITIQKTFRGRDGGWKQTSFLRPKFGDIKSLMEALDQLVDAHYGHPPDIHQGVRTMDGQSSFKIHCLAEYMKSRGFPLESDEVTELGPELVMAEYFDINVALSAEEADLLQKEMLELARQNEIMEAQQKMYELFPEDCGVVHFHQASHEPGERGTTYSLPFSYPVDPNLRSLPSRP
jgi:hypothetical protein